MATDTQEIKKSKNGVVEATEKNSDLSEVLRQAPDYANPRATTDTQDLSSEALAKEDERSEKTKKNQTNKELEACQEEVNNWKDKFIHAQADLDNFQKRTQKERAMWVSNAQAKIFTELLNIVDNFERAFGDQEKQTPETKGFVIIYKSLQKMLENFDVKKMDNYQTFDPNFHEALVQVDSDQHESGNIVEVLQPGYLFKNQVLRPAKVSVAK